MDNFYSNLIMHNGLYSIFSIFYTNYSSKSYDIELNKKRIKYGLFPITKDWKLDSTILQKPIRGMDCFRTGKIDTTYRFLEGKLYCQYWSNKNIDKTKAYENNKEILYFESFWFWKNKHFVEKHIFIKPQIDSDDYTKLEINTFLEDRLLPNNFDLFYVKNKENTHIDLNFELSTYDNKIDSILKQWHLK